MADDGMRDWAIGLAVSIDASDSDDDDFADVEASDDDRDLGALKYG